MKKLLLLISLTSLLLTALPAQSQGAEDLLNRIRIDESIPQIAPMVYCKTEVQRDCIEKLAIEHPDGTIELAKYVETRFVPFPDAQGQKVLYGDVIFDFNSESKAGVKKRLRISTNVKTPNFATDGKKWGIYWLFLQREALPGENIPIIGKCDRITIESCISYPSLGTKDKFHLYFRTSWLKPVSSSGFGVATSLQYQAIQGGFRWKFSGQEYLQPMFSDGDLLRKSATPEGADLLPDRLNPTLYAVIDHAGDSIANSFWDPRCADYGFTIASSNAPMAGQLYWDQVTESLSFNVYAPHLDPFGAINKGFFNARFQQAWLNCRFPGNSLSTATKISVQVLDEKGIPQVAVSSTSIKDGIIDIRASGFHYSSPRIVAKRDASSGNSTAYLSNKYGDDWSDTLLAPMQPVTAASVPIKKQTITCVQGKLTKKVVGTKPVCPKGFKKK